MVRCSMRIFVIIIIMLFGTTSFAAEPTETAIIIPPKLKDFIQKLESEKSDLQGGAFAVLYKGEVVYKTTFGYQKGQASPITDTTLFPLASVSKAVTATAVALMVDQGKLSFDETFKLPYLQYPVTLSNILGHTTGYYFTGNAQIEQGTSRQQILEVLKTQNPKCKPGACYFYSNMIFGLVEEALNTKQLSLQSIIQNLRLTLKTDGIQIVPIDPDLAVAYPHRIDKTKENQPATPRPFPPFYPKATPAAAGVFASIDGMIELFKLSFGYRTDLISQKTLDSLYKTDLTNHDIDKWQIGWLSDRDKIDSYYGLGWRIVKPKEHPGKDLIFHSGFISGVSTFIGFIPSEEIGIIILLNQHSPVALKGSMDFWGEFLK